ncbi:MAG TPA: YXWGXW repeat-containing protein [Steroidobacteraceae bacterium]|nr:YXWGXW repeat-containing protein [Steroidobacteraceae bacterium]
MSIKTVLCSVCLAGALIPGLGFAQVGIDVTVAPPAPQVEVVPPPRAGYVWAPGFWEWRDGRHVWVGGHWIVERPGYRWVPDRWERHGERWHHERGHWEH